MNGLVGRWMCEWVDTLERRMNVDGWVDGWVDTLGSRMNMDG